MSDQFARTSRRALATLFTGAVAAVTATMSYADAGWPTKPVTIVVPLWCRFRLVAAPTLLPAR